MSFDEQKGLVAASEEEDKRIAKLESRAGKWHDLLSDTINESIQHLQKKQSQTADEMAMDDGASSDDGMDDDGGVDIGCDGKPIPFWLYKLHGLGNESIQHLQKKQSQTA